MIAGIHLIQRTEKLFPDFCGYGMTEKIDRNDRRSIAGLKLLLRGCGECTAEERSAADESCET